MKGLVFVAGVALCGAWTASAVAQNSAPSVKVEPSEHRNTDLPRQSVGPTRQMESTPEKYDVSPEQQAYIQKAKQKVEAFRKEVETYRENMPSDSDRTEVDDMAREMHTLKEKWQWLKQTRGSDWDMARDQFETLYGDLRDEWRDVKQEGS